MILSVIILLIAYERDSAKAFYCGLASALVGVILLIVLSPAIDRELSQSKENTCYIRGSKCTVYGDGSVTTYTVDRITDTVILNNTKIDMTVDEFFEELENKGIRIKER